MKLRLFAPALLLGFSFTIPSPGQPATNTVPAVQRHPVWKVEGRSNVVYLAGSVDLLKRTDYPLPAPLEVAFSNAAIAVFEADLDQMSSPETTVRIWGISRLPEGQTLKNQLSPQTHAQFLKHVEESGKPAVLFESMQPVIALAMLREFVLQNLGVEAESRLERYFFERGKAEGKQIKALETVEFRLGLLTSFSRQESEMLVTNTLRELSDLKQNYDGIVAAWRTGDAAGIERFFMQSREVSPALFKRVVTDRNQSWVPKIEELLLGSKNAIVIVGVGHLVGRDSVVDLLTRKGFKVTQL